MVSMSSMSTSLYISVMTTTRAYTSIRELLDMLVMGGDSIALDNVPRVGAALVRLLCGKLPWRCPKSPFRQVKLTKPLISQYPAKILLSIWSLRCYVSRRRDTARTMWKLQ